MKKYIIVVFCFFLSLYFNSFAQQKVMTLVCEDKEEFPAVIGNSDQINPDKPGATIECVRLIEKKLGVKIIIKRLPWKRAFEGELKTGSADGLLGASYKKEREQFGMYPMKGDKPDESRSLYISSYYFYKLKKSNIEWNGRELKNLNGNIGAPFGYSIADDLKKMGYTVDESNGTSADFQNLIRGRVEAVAALELTGDAILLKNSEYAKQIVKVRIPIVTKAYYIILSHQFVKSNPELSVKFWDAVKEMKEKHYKKIAAKYN